MEPATFPQRLRGILDGGPVFGRRTVLVAYALAFLVPLVLLFQFALDRTALIRSIDPTFHGLMIGAGMFIAILFMVTDFDGAKHGLGNCPPVRSPDLFLNFVAFLLFVGLAMLCTNRLAYLLVEWRAFAWTAPRSHPVPFAIADRYQGRGRNVLVLASPASDFRFSLSCSPELYERSRLGGRFAVDVETGRGGVERAILPLHADALRPL